MGIVCSCDIRNGGNESMTISIISIIITIVANTIISTVMMTTPRHQRDIGTRETEVRSVVGMVIVGGGKDVVDIIVITMIMKVNSEDERVAIREDTLGGRWGASKCSPSLAVGALLTWMLDKSCTS